MSKESLGHLIRRRMKDLDIRSNSELARKTGLSDAYIGDLVNDRAKTKSGTYLPKPSAVFRLAEALEIPEGMILHAAGYSGRIYKSKPQTVAEFVQRLEEMGFDFYGFELDETAELGPDDLQDLMDDIEDKILAKTQRRKREAITK